MWFSFYSAILRFLLVALRFRWARVCDSFISNCWVLCTFLGVTDWLRACHCRVFFGHHPDRISAHSLACNQLCEAVQFLHGYLAIYIHFSSCSQLVGTYECWRFKRRRQAGGEDFSLDWRGFCVGHESCCVSSIFVRPFILLQLKVLLISCFSQPEHDSYQGTFTRFFISSYKRPRAILSMLGPCNQPGVRQVWIPCYCLFSCLPYLMSVYVYSCLFAYSVDSKMLDGNLWVFVMFVVSIFSWTLSNSMPEVSGHEGGVDRAKFVDVF